MTQAWESVRLEQVLKRTTETTAILANETYREVTIRMWGKGVTLRRVARGTEIAADRRILVRENQFIVSRIDARNGAFGLVPDFLDGAVVTSDFPSFEVNKAILEPEFLGWLSRTPQFVDWCKAASEGTTNRVRLVESRFLQTLIPLPPLEEQRRIVARVESLAAQIAEARGLREQAIQERELTYYAALKTMRENLLAQYPTNALGTVTKVTAGGTPSRENPTYWGGKIPWIKTGELFDSDIFDSEEHITQQGLEGSSAKLFPPETILIALYGQGQTRGRTGRLMLEASTNQACCAVLPSPDILESRFTQFWLQSLYKDMREQSQGGAQPNWNAGMIKDVLIVLPSLKIQQEILAKVDSLKSQLSSLEQLQEATRLELNALLPSVLSKAFAGEL